MNKRIYELALQAEMAAHNGDHVDVKIMMAKFGALIVQECMKVAASQRNPANLNYKPSERFVEDLRQHFGVE
jgi:hypothetical protein